MTTSTRFMRHGGQPAGITEQQAVAPLFFQDALFFRAQARVKSNPRCIKTKCKASVEPRFCRPAPGEGPLYDIPAYLRLQMDVERYDDQERNRRVAYEQRLRHLIGQAA